MASCNCKSKCFTSSGISNLNNTPCTDVCTNPICGTADALLLYAPVIYDCIGINLCRQVDLGVTISTTYPTAAYATAEVIDMTATTADITPIANRPNCFNVALSQLSFTLIVKLFDCCHRLLATLPITDVVYLPETTTDANYDEDTNPTNVTLQLYAPYGPAYTVTTAEAGATAVPVLIFNGMTTTQSAQTQGIQSSAVARVLSFDADTSSISLGLTLYVFSLYHSFYNFYNTTRGNIPKGNLATPEENVCMSFVRGSLLDRNIKPLELSPPSCEADLKQDCSVEAKTCDNTCS